MTEQPKPRAYCAALLFDDGQMLLMPVIGPDAPGAMAIAAYQAGQHTETEGHLTGYRLIELEADWLRRALRLIEGGKPTGDVVSLVSDNLRPASPFRAMTQPEAERILEGAAEIERSVLNGRQQTSHCPSHTWQPLRAGVCPLCQPNQ